MTKGERIRAMYEALFDRFGPQGWWPGDSGLECIIGAILTQNTAWSNVEKAITNLKREGLISVERLHETPVGRLAPLIRSSGYFNQKAKKIKHFIAFLVERYDGSLEEMFGEDTASLRRELLGINGIGPETADSILLYAGGKPTFVVDAYTVRILQRHGLVPESTTYEEVQDAVIASLPEDPELFNEYHALLVRVGKERCKKRSPVCEGCPLEGDPHNV